MPVPARLHLWALLLLSWAPAMAQTPTPVGSPAPVQGAQATQAAQAGQPSQAAQQPQAPVLTPAQQEAHNAALQHNDEGVKAGLAGTWDRALSEGNAAWTAEPENIVFKQNYSTAQMRYGDVLASQKKYPEAMAHYRQALFVDPLNGQAETNLKTILTSVGVAAGDIKVRHAQADALSKAGKYQEASAEYAECVKMEKSGPNFFYYGRSLFRAGKIGLGKKAIETALEMPWPADQARLHADCQQLLKGMK